MEFQKNEELENLKTELQSLNSTLQIHYPDLAQDPPDFKSYSHCISFLKHQYRSFVTKFLDLHHALNQARHGQQFFKISQDLAQVKGKLKTKDDAVAKLKKENDFLQREISLLTGKIDSSAVFMENQNLKSKVFELQEELRVLKGLYQQDIGNFEGDDREWAGRSGEVRPTPRFLDSSEGISNMAKSEKKILGSPKGNAKEMSSAVIQMGKKISEFIIELFDSGDLPAAVSKWRESNFLYLETATDKQNFEFLRKSTLFIVKLSENLSTTISYDPSKPSEILRLEDENLMLRRKVAEKSNKLSSFYESQEIKKDKKLEPQESELEPLKKMVYDSSARLIYLENQIKLLKIKAPSIARLQESLIQGDKNASQLLVDYLQNKLFEELERVKVPALENLRVALLQVVKEKTDLFYESFSYKCQVNTLEKLLEEERQLKKLLKSNKGISGLDNWKAYKRDYLTRVELAYKTEIKELNDCIQRLKNELKMSSSEIEERYMKELQDLAGKLKKEHQDKKKLAEILSKSRNIKQEEIIEHKYAECKQALQESNEKIFGLEQELFSLNEKNNEIAEKAEELAEELQNKSDENQKQQEDIGNFLGKVEKLGVEKQNLEIELKKVKEASEKRVLEAQNREESLKVLTEKLGDKLEEAEQKIRETEQASHSTISATSKELQEFRQKFQRTKEKKRLSIIQVQKLEGNYNSKTEELDAITSLLNETKEKLSKTGEEKMKLNEKLKNLNNELSKYSEENLNINEKVKKLKTELEESHRNAENYRTEIKSRLGQIQNLELAIDRNKEGFMKRESKILEEKERFLEKIEFLEGVLEEKQKEIVAKELETKEFYGRVEEVEEVLREKFELKKNFDQIKGSLELLAGQIKDFYLAFCKETKIDPPLLSKAPDDMLYEIYMHLISLCRTLNTSQQHIDISFEEPQATNDDYKIKYNELICKTSLNHIEDSRKVLEKLQRAKSLNEIDNLQDWVLEKWQSSIEDCDKLRQQLILANQELDSRIKSDSSNYLEKAKEDIKAFKQDLEKKNSEMLDTHMRHTSLLNELEYLKQEKYQIEKSMYQKVSAAEAEMQEWRNCFLDLYSQFPKSSKTTTECSPSEMRSEVLTLINKLQSTENNAQQLLQENSHLIKLTEKYSKDLKRAQEDCEYLEKHLKESSEVFKENGLLRSKFSQLLEEKEYLENKLNYVQSELLPTSMHEEKAIREALETELLNKCDLVKELAEEIDKYKKYLKVREYEYQELLTLKDEEILRMRLRSS